MFFFLYVPVFEPSLAVLQIPKSCNRSHVQFIHARGKHDKICINGLFPGSCSILTPYYLGLKNTDKQEPKIILYHRSYRHINLINLRIHSFSVSVLATGAVGMRLATPDRHMTPQTQQGLHNGSCEDPVATEGTVGEPQEIFSHARELEKS